MSVTPVLFREDSSATTLSDQPDAQPHEWDLNEDDIIMDADELFAMASDLEQQDAIPPWTYSMFVTQHKHEKREYAQKANAGSKHIVSVLVTVANVGFIASGFPNNLVADNTPHPDPTWLKDPAFWQQWEYGQHIKALAVGRELTPTSRVPHYHMALTFNPSAVTRFQLLSSLFERFSLRTGLKIDVTTAKFEPGRTLGLPMAMYSYVCKEDKQPLLYNMDPAQIQAMFAKVATTAPQATTPSKKHLVDMAYTDVIDKKRTAAEVTLQARTRAEFIERNNLAELEQLHKTAELMTRHITDRFMALPCDKVYGPHRFNKVQLDFMKLLAHMLKNFAHLEQRQLNIGVLGPSAIGKSTIMLALQNCKDILSVFIGNDNNSQFPLSGLHQTDFLFWDEFGSLMPVNTFKEVTASLECNCNVKGSFVMKRWKTINVFISNEQALYPAEPRVHRDAVESRFILPQFTATPGSCAMPAAALLNVHEDQIAPVAGAKLDPYIIACTIRRLMDIIPDMVVTDFITADDATNVVFA